MKQNGAFTSGLGGRCVDLARVAVEQAVEGTVPEGGGEHAPQTNDHEDQLNLHRSKEVKHNHRGSQDGPYGPLRAPDVPHLTHFYGLPDLMRCLQRTQMLTPNHMSVQNESRLSCGQGERGALDEPEVPRPNMGEEEGGEPTFTTSTGTTCVPLFLCTP